MDCPLCGSSSDPFFQGKRREYDKCPVCQLISLIDEHRLDEKAERERYERHNNDVDDPGYQRFVKPVVDAILEQYTPDNRGLDFGCGNGPVISYLLEKEGFRISKYDPFFHPDRSVLKEGYDFIILSEVMEHFHDPSREFELLFSLLEPNGKIFCLTDLYGDSIDFENWYYKDDETHVLFYHWKSIEYISSRFGNSKYSIDGRMIIFN